MDKQATNPLSSTSRRAVLTGAAGVAAAGALTGSANAALAPSGDLIELRRLGPILFEAWGLNQPSR